MNIEKAKQFIRTQHALYLKEGWEPFTQEIVNNGSMSIPAELQEQGINSYWPHEAALFVKLDAFLNMNLPFNIEKREGDLSDFMPYQLVAFDDHIAFYAFVSKHELEQYPSLRKMADELEKAYETAPFADYELWEDEELLTGDELREVI